MSDVDPVAAALGVGDSPDTRGVLSEVADSERDSADSDTSQDRMSENTGALTGDYDTSDTSDSVRYGCATGLGSTGSVSRRWRTTSPP